MSLKTKFKVSKISAGLVGINFNGSEILTLSKEGDQWYLRPNIHNWRNFRFSAKPFSKKKKALSWVEKTVIMRQPVPRKERRRCTAIPARDRSSI